MGSPRSKKERRKSKNINSVTARTRPTGRPVRARAHDDYDPGEQRATSSIGAALQALVEPYEESAHAEGWYQELFQLGALAWNISVLPEADEPELVQKAVDAAGAEDRDAMKAMLLEMIGRARRARKKARARQRGLDDCGSGTTAFTVNSIQVEENDPGKQKSDTLFGKLRRILSR